MSQRRRRIVDISKLLGPVNMTYDNALAEFEVIQRHPHLRIFLPVETRNPSPEQTERKTNEFLRRELNSYLERCGYAVAK